MGKWSFGRWIFILKNARMIYMKSDIKDIVKLLDKGVSEVIVKEHLEKELLAGKKLRIKFGIDPTASFLHLGHTVPLGKLKQFQDAGHTAVLIIGDYTAQIGDPTGRVEGRSPLSEEDIEKNMESYLAQASRIIDVSKAELHYNSEWFKKGGSEVILQLSRAGTMQQVLHRADFKKRLDEDHDITLAEILYPLMQGYDSVMVKADVELGGADQLFNLLMGRRVQRHFKMPEQDIMTVPLLVGTDGVKKMSKSADNFIGVTENPDVMFGKIMSVPDSLIDSYYELCAGKSREIKDPRKAKLELGRIIVDVYHGERAGEKARKEFVKVFSEKKRPAEIEEVRLGTKAMTLVELLMKSGLAKSKGESRRLIEQGGVKVDDVKQSDPTTVIDLSSPKVVQVGPRKFLKLGE